MTKLHLTFCHSNNADTQRKGHSLFFFIVRLCIHGLFIIIVVVVGVMADVLQANLCDLKQHQPQRS